MKPKPIIALVVMIGLSLVMMAGGCRHNRRVEQVSAADDGNAEKFIAPSDTAKEGKEPASSIVDKGGADVDFPEREEIRRSYKLLLGARVSVQGINGKVDVESADTETAELLIVRSAKNRDDLRFRRIRIEHEPERLRIGIVDDRKSVWSAFGKLPEGRQRVILRLPRRVEFDARGLNGHLTVGEIDGKVSVNGTNGPIKIVQANGEVSFRGINGDIDATIAKLSGEGVRISGVNGNTTLRFIGDVNADIESHGMNGRIEPEFQNIDIKKNEGWGSYQARIGSGGVRIEIHGVNGNVYLSKAEKATADKATAESSKAPAKTNSTK